MNKKLLAALALVSSFSCHAFTANELLNWYERGNESQTFAKGFILGVWHTMDSCTPKGADLGQVTDVVIMAMKKMPQQRHVEATIFVQAIIATEWKCKVSKKEKDMQS